MKTKTICLCFCMIMFGLFLNIVTTAQQPKNSNPGNTLPVQINGIANSNYTYRLFIAPNKVYGYDIFFNNNIIFHQPAFAEPTGNKEAALLKKQQAEKAAEMAIDKIKRGMTAELTIEDLMQITGH